MPRPPATGRMLCSFFFQAEDGIRDSSVTGVQTCALPICLSHAIICDSGSPDLGSMRSGIGRCAVLRRLDAEPGDVERRSEERRVGKECRSRWWREHEKKKVERET